MSWLEVTVNIIQGLFFIIIAYLAVLTYRSARKTILQPIRTEVFKEQLSIINELGQHFIGKDEIMLRGDLDFENLIIANSLDMMDSYAHAVLGIEIDAEKRPYSHDKCPISLISVEDLRAYGAYTTEERKLDGDKLEEPSTIDWSKYKVIEIHLTNKHCEAMEKLRMVIRNPLLPKECKEILTKYLDIIQDNITLIKIVLTKAAKKMPKEYPDRDKMSIASLSWIENLYAAEFKGLETTALELEGVLRQYLGTDNLLSR